METFSLREKTAKGLLWGGVSNGVQQLLNLLFGILLARMLTPADYGMVGVLAVFSVVATTLQESGFTAALVNKREARHEDYNAVFWFSIGMSVALYALLFFSAPWIAHFYQRPELTALARYSFIGFLLSALGTAQSAFLFKRLMVKQRALAQMTALVVSGIVGVGMAYGGCSYWSIATQSITSVGVTTLLYWHFSPWRPTLHFRLTPLKEMFAFSSKLLVTNMFSHINYNLFSVILGRFYTTREVGLYDQAYKWSCMGGLFIIGTTNSVAQPTLAALSADAARQRRAFLRLLSFVSFVSFPLMFGLGFIAEPLVSMALTDKWTAMVPLLQLLCLSGAFVPITNLCQQLLISRGCSGTYMCGVIVEGLLILAGLYLAHPYGVKVMLATYVAIYIAFLAMWLHWVIRLIGLTLKDFIRTAAPYLLATLVTLPLVAFLTDTLFMTLLIPIFYLAILWGCRNALLRDIVHYLFHRS